MRSPAVVSRGSSSRGGCLVHGLAALGAVFVVLLVVGAVGFVALTRPLDSASAPPPTPAASASGEPAAPTDLAQGETWLPGVDLTAPRLLVGGGQELRSVTAKGEGARLAADGSVRAQHLDIDGVVPFAVAEQAIGRGVRLAPGEDGLVQVTLPVGAFGRGLDLKTLARVEADGDRLAVTPVRMVDGGILGDVLSRFPTLRQKIDGLPPGMRLTEVRVTDSGFHVHAVGDDVTLPR